MLGKAIVKMQYMS